MDKGESKPVAMKVWQPNGDVISVMTIASESHHLGNKIAEGRMPESEFWPSMYDGARRDEAHVRRQYLSLRDQIECDRYSAGWIGRCLEYWEADDV